MQQKKVSCNFPWKLLVSGSAKRKFVFFRKKIAIFFGLRLFHFYLYPKTSHNSFGRLVASGPAKGKFVFSEKIVFFFRPLAFPAPKGIVLSWKLVANCSSTGNLAFFEKERSWFPRFFVAFDRSTFLATSRHCCANQRRSGIASVVYIVVEAWPSWCLRM